MSKEIPIILVRYIWREMYGCLLAITLILLAIFITNQFSHFLKMAASGQMTIGIAVKLVGLQIPVLLTYLLPLGFYLSVLITFGRLYIDHEMTVMTVCGMSLWRQLRIVLVMGLAVAALCAWLTMWLVPMLQKNAYQMRDTFAKQFKLETLVPKQFNHFSKGDVLYFDKMSHRSHTAHNVFLAVRQQAKSPTVPSKWDIAVAYTAHAQKVPYANGRYIVSKSGYRYSGIPGQPDFQSIQYAENGVDVASALLGKSNAAHHLSHKKEVYGLSTIALWKLHAHDRLANAELQLRFAIPISVLIVSLLGIGLCKVDPRRGKFAQIIPAILLYVFYADMIFVSRAWLQRGVIPEWLGMWWIHGLMFVLSLAILIRHLGWRQLRASITGPSEVTPSCAS